MDEQKFNEEVLPMMKKFNEEILPKITEQMSNKQIMVKLYQLCLEMGHIIRYFDEDCAFLEYWTNDGEYISNYGPMDFIYKR